MGRRKKEPEAVHRENISSAAEHLFLQKAIEAAAMDEIAKEAGYSKATLYVYFTNKEKIIGFLVLKSMKMLRSILVEAVTGAGQAKEKYGRICQALAMYQEQYALCFSVALGKINVEFEKEDSLPVEKEIFEVGEQINAALVGFIRSGIDAGELRPDIPVPQTVFLFSLMF